MGVNNFFCILLTRPPIEASPERVRAFYSLCPHKPYSGVMRTHRRVCQTRTRDELAPLQNLEEGGLPQSHLLKLLKS